jgi:hypothetical protein
MMPDFLWSESEEIAPLQIERPHLVILGAGASLAALPAGDRNGKRLPLMKTFADVVGLKATLRAGGISEPYDDFEKIYSDIAANPSCQGLKAEIERRVETYFSSLELPDKPTLFDHLVLSLRPKDVIATFNWDPFLCQAAKRNHLFGGAPKLLFLHGNVAFSYCTKCKTGYPAQATCRNCGGPLVRSPLLYPVSKKNYQKHPAIKIHWSNCETTLTNACALTIFGYGSPQTDIEAIRLMKKGWGPPSRRNLEQIELIDVKSEDDLTTTWAPFIHSNHYTIQRSFYDSYIARFPRRSGEALWTQHMEIKFPDPHIFPQEADFLDLYRWLQPRIDAEQQAS